MKLRQKLAMVLAAAMVVTAVPVTTMATSTNNLNKTVSLVEGTKVTTSDDLFLNIDVNATHFADVDLENDEDTVFVITATDFEFEKAVYEAAIAPATKTVEEDANGLKLEGIKVLSAAADEIVVQLTGTTKEVVFEVAGKAKKGTPKITVDGLDSIVSSSELAIGGEIVTDKALAATAGDATSISVDGNGKIADIKITEKVAGELSEQTITIELDRKSDLVFDIEQTVTAKAGLGLAGTKDLIKEVKFGEKKVTEDKDGNEVVSYSDDKEIINITFNKFDKSARGHVTIEGLEVKAENPRDEVGVGEVEVEVTGAKLADTDLVVANVAEYDVLLTVAEEKELVAGREGETVKVKLAEAAVDSFDARKDVYMTVEGATVVADKNDVVYNKDNATVTYLGDNEFQVEFKALSTEKPEAIEFEIDLKAKVQHDGDVTLTAESRGFDEELSVVVATVAPILEVETEEAVLKAGLNEQKAGEIVISEIEAETFERDSVILISVDKADRYGISIEDATVEIDGDIELEDLKVVDVFNDDDEFVGQALKLVVDRESDDEASTITIKDIEFDVDRTAPEGQFDIVISGDAICENDGELKVEDFIQIGTKNTEDIQDASKVKEVILAIDSTDYTVDGEAKVGAAAPYIEAGRTMIPTRLVSEEFGATVDFNTLNGVGTVTIQKEGTTIQFQNGTNVLNKNGIQIPMDAKTVIKDGVTYVPFRYLATALNITDFSYDQATNTVTFKN